MVVELGELVDVERARRVFDDLSKISLEGVDKRVAQTFIGDVVGLRRETLKFLSIAGVGEGAFAPSKTVDEYWHELITHTRTYNEVCAKIGRFVHHAPSDKKEVEVYARTCSAYESVFGSLDQNYWKTGSDCDTFCTSGACEASCRDSK